MDLDTALLRAFVAVEQERHFGRAAQRLFISQQALSKRIARLERLVATQLIDRRRHPIQLTPPGEALLPFARDALEAVDAAATSVGVGPELRVDVMDEHSAAGEMVTAAVTAHPQLRVRTSARGDKHTAIEVLEAGTADIALGQPGAAPWPRDLRKRPALAEPLGLLLSVDHEWASRESVSMSEVREADLSFPMSGAPQEWVNFVEAMNDDFALEINRDGCSVTFDHFLDLPAQRPGVMSLLGVRMRPPSGRAVAVVPIVEPAPVFVWTVMWRRRIPESLVNMIAPPDAFAMPINAWQPPSDR